MVNFGNIMLSKLSQIEKDKYHVAPLRWNECSKRVTKGWGAEEEVFFHGYNFNMDSGEVLGDGYIAEYI